MATKREFLKAQGITVGKRGRFSAAAVNKWGNIRGGIKVTKEVTNLLYGGLA